MKIAVLFVMALGSCAYPAMPSTCARQIAVARTGFVEECSFARNQDCREPLSATMREQWKVVLFGYIPEEVDGGPDRISCTRAFEDLLRQEVQLVGFAGEMVDPASQPKGPARMIRILTPVPKDRWLGRNFPSDTVEIDGATVRQLPNGLVAATGHVAFRRYDRNLDRSLSPGIVLRKD